MDLTFDESTVGEWSVIAVAGELDLHTAPLLRDRLEAMDLSERPNIAVDLTDVSFMDSSTLGVLVVQLKRVREREGRLGLVGVQGSPAKVLSITGLDQVIPAFESVEDLPQG